MIHWATASVTKLLRKWSCRLLIACKILSKCLTHIPNTWWYFIKKIHSNIHIIVNIHTQQDRKMKWNSWYTIKKIGEWGSVSKLKVQIIHLTRDKLVISFLHKPLPTDLPFFLKPWFIHNTIISFDLYIILLLTCT